MPTLIIISNNQGAISKEGNKGRKKIKNQIVHVFKNCVSFSRGGLSIKRRCAP